MFFLHRVPQCVTIKQVNISELDWDDENTEHITRHSVTPEEVGAACYGVHIVKKKGGRYILSGQSGEGRYLLVVLEPRGKGRFRPITAFEMDDEQKRRYRKKLR